MDREFRLVPENDNEEASRDCQEGTVVITLDDFYDLLMEQQEQM